MTIEVNFCDRAAALYAVEKWHYSRTLPTDPLFRLGVWEDGRFIGAVVFSRGNTQRLGSPYGAGMSETCELSRVALDEHETPTTQILAEALRVLKERNPGLRLIVSFADPNVGHLGVIYQAGGWIYSGRSGSDYKVIDRAGREWHSRQVSPSGWKVQYGKLRKVARPQDGRVVRLLGKFRYLMHLDRAMRRRLRPFALPYPRGLGVDSDTSGLRSEGAGATPADRSRRAPRSRQPRH